jgi:hypothetical protein
LVRGLGRAKIRYAVAGGLALGLHGQVRATEDMDFLVHPDDLPAMASLLKRLHYRANLIEQELRHGGLVLRRYWKRAARDGDLLVVDVLTPTSARTRAHLERALTIPFGKGTVRVVTAKDLIAMKRARGSAADRADVAYLRKHA